MAVDAPIKFSYKFFNINVKRLINNSNTCNLKTRMPALSYRYRTMDRLCPRGVQSGPGALSCDDGGAVDL